MGRIHGRSAPARAKDDAKQTGWPINNSMRAKTKRLHIRKHYGARKLAEYCCKEVERGLDFCRECGREVGGREIGEREGR